MRLQSILPSGPGSSHRSPSLDFRMPRRRSGSRSRPPVVVVPGDPRPPVLPWELFPDEEAKERKRGLWALWLALLFHAVLLLTIWPELDLWPEPERPDRERKFYVVEPTRFRLPPPPPAGGRPQVRKEAKLIPVPDLTPDLPEPWLSDLPEIDYLPEIDLPVDIPPGPGGPSATTASAGGDGWEQAGRRHGALRLTGDMVAPVKIHGPQPRYTEAARLEKLEGFVIVEAIIDTDGNVVEARVRKGLPMGLSESAVEAVLNWKYEPATRQGRPVAVYLAVSVAFRVQ